MREITKSNTKPDASNTWFIMTNLPGKVQQVLGQLYSLRNWIEYGFNQVKNQLGWADFRLTDYQSIERWWEIVFSTYLLVSLHALQFKSTVDDAGDSPNSTGESSETLTNATKEISQHVWWESGTNKEECFKQLKVDYSALYLLVFD